MERRGISAVVTTILLVLLSLAAVLLVWGFVRGIITDAGEDLDITELGLRYSIPGQTVSVNVPLEEIDFVIRRDSGKGNIPGFIVIIEDENGVGASRRVDVVIDELESKRISLNFSDEGLGKISKIKIAPIIVKENGEEIQGSVAAVYNINEDNICDPKVLIIDDKGFANSGVKHIENALLDLGFDVTKDYTAATLADLSGFDVIASIGYVWSVGKGALLKEAYDNGYAILTQGNDAGTGNIYPITGHAFTGAGGAVPQIDWTMDKATPCSHEICEGWDQVGSTQDSGNYITDVVPDAQILARMKEKDIDDINHIALLAVEEGQGKWVHVQPHLNVPGEREILLGNILSWLCK